LPCCVLRIWRTSECAEQDVRDTERPTRPETPTSYSLRAEGNPLPEQPPISPHRFVARYSSASVARVSKAKLSNAREQERQSRSSRNLRWRSAVWRERFSSVERRNG